MNLSVDELKLAQQLTRDKGLIISIASRSSRVLPGGPEITAGSTDIFASSLRRPALPRRPGVRHRRNDGRKDHSRLFLLANRGSDKCFDGVVEALTWLCEGRKRNLIIGLEQTPATSVRRESQIFKALTHPNLKLVWDPANALCSGESPFPEGYPSCPRIVSSTFTEGLPHGRLPVGPLGTRDVAERPDRRLMADGYHGWLSLETHWPGRAGTKRLVARSVAGTCAVYSDTELPGQPTGFTLIGTEVQL